MYGVTKFQRDESSLTNIIHIIITQRNAPPCLRGFRPELLVKVARRTLVTIIIHEFFLENRENFILPPFDAFLAFIVFTYNVDYVKTLV